MEGHPYHPAVQQLPVVEQPEQVELTDTVVLHTEPEAAAPE
jgi:hypothetical protein